MLYAGAVCLYTQCMCGRYAFDEPELLLSCFGLPCPGSILRARYNAAPGQDMPVVKVDERGNPVLTFMKWGLVVHRNKKVPGKSVTINARIETVTQKPVFRHAIEETRCLVPATGFFEWTPERQPYFFRSEKRNLLFFAGLYDCRQDNRSGDSLPSFTILTTAAGESVSPVHERMPVILPAGQELEWVRPASAEQALRALQADSEEPLEGYPVSTAVNSVRNDNEQLIRPVFAPPKLPGL